MRFETELGRQMQVDFVVFKRCGLRLLAFVATLGYSRMSFVRFVGDETWPTVKGCLEAAFGYFGGVPCEVLFDNMKTMVLERNAYGRGAHRLHPGLLALSRDLYVPVAGLLALLAFVLFSVPLLQFITFGGALGIVDGLVAWWVLMLLPALVYAAYGMPWAPRQ